MRNGWIGFGVAVVIAAPAHTFPVRPPAILTHASPAVIAGANVTWTNVGFACLAVLGSAHQEEL